MNKRTITTCALAMMLAACSSQEQISEQPAPTGMRDGAAVAVTLGIDEATQYPKKGASVERNWQGQPPLIPHDYKKKITAKRNGCVSCHEPKRAEKMNTTAIHASHYEADGKLDNAYYNCNQCHVAQASNAKVLIGNTQ